MCHPHSMENALPMLAPLTSAGNDGFHQFTTHGQSPCHGLCPSPQIQQLRRTNHDLRKMSRRQTTAEPARRLSETARSATSSNARPRPLQDKNFRKRAQLPAQARTFYQLLWRHRRQLLSVFHRMKTMTKSLKLNRREQAEAQEPHAQRSPPKKQKTEKKSDDQTIRHLTLFRQEAIKTTHPEQLHDSLLSRSAQSSFVILNRDTITWSSDEEACLLVPPRADLYYGKTLPL